MFFSIRSQIFKFKKRGDVSSGLKGQEIINKWSEIVSKVNVAAKHHTSVVSFEENKELVINVDSVVWLQELSFYNKTLKDQINNKYGEDTVKSIRFIA
jgi:predicted nucleic acid-binding Zn ribbon protein